MKSSLSIKAVAAAASVSASSSASGDASLPPVQYKEFAGEVVQHAAV